MDDAAPAVPPAYDRTEELLAALGVEESLLPVEVYENGPRHVLVRLADQDAVAALRPDLAALAGHERVGINCFAGEGTQWKLRMFGPAIGIAEDPATGSAAGPLASILGRHGVVPFGRRSRSAKASRSIGRPPSTPAPPASDEGPEVGGAAVVVARGRYRSHVMFDSETFGCAREPEAACRSSSGSRTRGRTSPRSGTAISLRTASA